ncbi:MAG: hypothetical protein Q4P30_06180, partial [Eubacteriales bacterium]|nr:hypothetical protein [Eubacteriales bacterium]
RYGYRLFELARGIDRRPVCAERKRKQLSLETTLTTDEPLHVITKRLAELAEDLWKQALRHGISGRCVTLKLKTSDFQIITRSQTYSSMPESKEDLFQAASRLTERVDFPQKTLYRLIGIGLSDLHTYE